MLRLRRSEASNRIAPKTVPPPGAKCTYQSRHQAGNDYSGETSAYFAWWHASNMKISDSGFVMVLFATHHLEADTTLAQQSLDQQQ